MADAAEEYGVSVRWRAGRLYLIFPKGEVVADSRETAGPVTKRILKSWSRGLGGEFMILATLGFYLREAVAAALLEPEFKGRVTLLEAGLRDYMDEKVKPRGFIAGPRGLAEVVGVASEKLGFKFLGYPCDLCGEPIRGACQECGYILCSNHLIICPICHSTFCHPDTGRRCFYGHRCR